MVNRNIKSKIIKYKMVERTLSCLMVMIILTILIIIFREKAVKYDFWIKIGYWLMLVSYMVDIFIKPFIDVKTWNCSILEDRIEYSFGILTIEKVVLPISRVQSVTTVKTPLLNKFGLVKVEVKTAMDTHELRNISLEEGLILEKKIMETIFRQNRHGEKSNYYNEIVNEEVQVSNEESLILDEVENGDL